jgi:SAM-dependent methyltransferase
MRAARVFGGVNGYLACGCSNCGTIFTQRLPEPSDAMDYEEFYAAGRDVEVPPFVLGRLERTVASLEQYRRLNRWLDVGCGAGTLLRALANRGWHAVGTEVAPAAVNAARGLGFEVHLGETGKLDLPPASFDVISLIEVLEHVPDPDWLLAAAARLMRPWGALYLTTPNGRSLTARLLGTRWTVISPPEHLQLFSVKGLHAALARSGFLVRRTWTHGLNPYELRAGLTHGRERPLDHDLTRTSYHLNESLSNNRGGAVAKRLVNAALDGARLGDTLKVLAERPASSGQTR